MEQREAEVRSLEIRSEGGNPVKFYETPNIRPGILIAVADGGLAWEGTVAELGSVGIFEKPGIMIVAHPQTKALIDSAIKKATRKFKPGEAVPGLTPRKVGMNPALGVPYGGSGGRSQ